MASLLKRDDFLTWLKVLWILFGFIFFPLLYVFVTVVRSPFVIIGYILFMAVAIYFTFIRDAEEAPLFSPRSCAAASHHVIHMEMPLVFDYHADKRRREEDGEKEEEQCVICLCEYEEEEKLVFLPCCRHIFHVKCIQKWFNCHKRCPVCNASSLPLPARTEAPVPLLQALSCNL